MKPGDLVRVCSRNPQRIIDRHGIGLVIEAHAVRGPEEPRVFVLWSGPRPDNPIDEVYRSVLDVIGT